MKKFTLAPKVVTASEDGTLQISQGTIMLAKRILVNMKVDEDTLEYDMLLGMCIFLMAATFKRDASNPFSNRTKLLNLKSALMSSRVRLLPALTYTADTFRDRDSAANQQNFQGYLDLTKSREPSQNRGV